jgi:uncharacterized membrane protein YphA (DoxX/SURF4 family)
VRRERAAGTDLFPFPMIEFTGGNPAAQDVSLGSYFKTIAILRIGAGLLLLARHGVEGVLGAYQFLWSEQEWDWAQQAAQAGLPYPHLTTPLLALIVGAVGLSWTLGFLTRLFAILFLPVVITFLVYVRFGGGAYIEVAWLYLIIAVTLMLFGSGALSLDKLFHLGADFRAGRFKKKKNRW